MPDMSAKNVFFLDGSPQLDQHMEIIGLILVFSKKKYFFFSLSVYEAKETIFMKCPVAGWIVQLTV